MRKLLILALLGSGILLAVACKSAAVASVPDDAGDDTAADAGTDAGTDTAAADADTDVELPETCTEPGGKPYVEQSAPDPTRKKFALSLYHFNIEYVIGGLEYIDIKGLSHVFTANSDNVGWDNDKVEDFIVRESFLPMLQMYEKHPTWGVDFELQAYMIDVMAARHPDVLILLRKLAQRGQAELISFHYNAQLFLGFPREDHHRSIEAVKATFTKHCLPLSGVVFNQEGQAGEGRQKALVDEGYSIGVYPKNLFYYQHNKTLNPWPYFTSEGGDLIVGSSGVDKSSGIQLTWNFFDDGELAAAPKVSGQSLNPYFATSAAHDATEIAARESELAATEAQGYYMARIGDYVRHLKASNIEEKPAPALLDGTWQPKSTDSIHRWLGGRGLWGQDENDFEVRQGNYEARTQVAAVQVLAEVAQKAGKGLVDQDKRLTKLWKLLWRVEVSDCSGVNPWLAEVQFALDHNPQIIADAKKLAEDLKKSLGFAHAHVDLDQRTAVDALPDAENLQAVDPPSELSSVTVNAGGRKWKTTWQQVGMKHWRVQYAFTPSDPDMDPAGREIHIDFPHFEQTIEYSPALLDDVVRTYKYTDFELDSFNTGDYHVWLPVPNGLIGLGKGWYIIKHARLANTAVKIDFTVPIVSFADETLRLDLAPTWTYDVVEGTATEALKVARAVNIAPTVDF